MKTVIIGDIHGHDSWKQIIEQEQNADRFIFVGDYFDSFTVPGATQVQNFQDIIEFKETNGKETILLIGNHDYQPLVREVEVEEDVNDEHDPNEIKKYTI